MIVKHGDTFTSIAQEFNVKERHLLRLYHNLHCPEEDVMFGNLIVRRRNYCFCKY